MKRRKRFYKLVDEFCSLRKRVLEEIELDRLLFEAPEEEVLEKMDALMELSKTQRSGFRSANLMKIIQLLPDGQEELKLKVKKCLDEIFLEFIKEKDVYNETLGEFYEDFIRAAGRIYDRSPKSYVARLFETTKKRWRARRNLKAERFVFECEFDSEEDSISFETYLSIKLHAPSCSVENLVIAKEMIENGRVQPVM